MILLAYYYFIADQKMWDSQTALDSDATVVETCMETTSHSSTFFG
jgi:hypothetical protein